MFKIGWLQNNLVTDAIHAELVHEMYKSRIGVRWTVIVAAPPTLYAVTNASSPITIVACVAVWISCLIRIWLSETYVRGGSIRQDRERQDRWQRRYLFAGVLFSTALGLFSADMVLSYGPWMAVWALTTVVGYSYGIIAYVALRPFIAWPQTSIPILISIVALLVAGERQQIWIAACLLIAILSVLGHIKRHYIASLDALLNRRMIERMATTDHLTGLWNRRYLDQAVTAAIAAMPAEISFFSIDLDRFKAVNDTFGHEAGDLVIKEAGRRIWEACGPHALVARIGGDEFAVLVPEGGVAAERTAWRIVSMMGRPISVQGGLAHVGASVGLAVVAAEDTVVSLNRRADEAMYEAKAGSKKIACSSRTRSAAKPRCGPSSF